jgi:autotransporter-associated beta strand protein
MQAHHIFRAATIALVFFPGLAAAQSSSWIQATSGTYNWSLIADWQNNTPADGADNTATFATANLTGPISVPLDSSRTIGALVFDNPTNTFGWSIIGSNTLTLTNSAGPVIAVNNANISANVLAPVGGSQGFNKTGAGTLVLAANNTGLNGGITVTAGTLAATGSATINPLGSNTITLAGGTLKLGGGGFNQKMVVPAQFANANGGTAFAQANAGGFLTATMDGGTAKTGNTWYEVGTNPAAPSTGLPMGQTVTSQSSATLMYTLQASTTLNTLMFDNAGGNTNGRLTLTTPTTLSQVSFLTSSGNGAGTLTATLHYSDGTADASGLTFTSPDWFGNTPVAINANGRVNSGGFANVSSGNPRLYDEGFANPNPASPISSIDLTWTGGTNTHTAIFAVANAAVLNGDPAQNFTNNVIVTASSGIDIHTANGGSLGNVSFVNDAAVTVTGVPGAVLTLGNFTLSANPTLNTGVGITVNPGSFSDGGTARTITFGGTGTVNLGTASPGLSAATSAVVTGGTVNLTNATALGASPSVAVNGGTLNLNVNNANFSCLSTAVGVSGGNVVFNGHTLNVGSGTGNYGGTLSDGSGPGTLNKNGAGTQTLSGTNLLTGGVIVASGTLAATAPPALGHAPITMTGGTLSVSGVDTPIASVSGFANFTVNGNAVNNGNSITVTPATAGQAGSAWNNTQVPTGPFTASFSYLASNGSANPADGVTITLQNDTRGTAALGGGGGFLGYGGVAGTAVSPSGSFQINVYQPNIRGVGFGQNGSIATNTPTGFEIYNVPINVSLTYDGGLLTANVTDGTNSFTTSVPMNLAALLGPNAYIGFTGATGGEFAQQDVSNFNFATQKLSTYANTVAVTAGSNATIAVAALPGVPTVTMGALTMNTGSTLNVTPAAGTPTGQVFGLTFPTTTLSGNATFNVANNGSGAGTLDLGTVSGTGGLTKAGPGRLNANGTVGGTLAVQAGTLAPGSNGPGLLNVGGSATFTGGSFLAYLNGTAPGGSYTQLAVTGPLSLGAGITQLMTNLGYAPGSGDVLTIMTGSLVSGNFAGLPNNQSFVVGSFNGTTYTGIVQYNPGSVILTGFVPVPEPACVLLACGLTGSAAWWRRRRLSRAGAGPTRVVA